MPKKTFYKIEGEYQETTGGGSYQFFVNGEHSPLPPRLVFYIAKQYIKELLEIQDANFGNGLLEREKKVLYQRGFVKRKKLSNPLIKQP